MPRRACGCRGDEPRAANPEAAPGLRQRIRRGAPLARLANPIRSPARVQSIRRCLLLTRARTARDSRAPRPVVYLHPSSLIRRPGPGRITGHGTWPGVCVRAAQGRGQGVRSYVLLFQPRLRPVSWHASCPHVLLLLQIAVAAAAAASTIRDSGLSIDHRWACGARLGP